MPVFQLVVGQLLLDGLGESGLTDEVREAWGWWWSWLTESMMAVERGQGTQAGLVQASWDAVTEGLSLDAVGGRIYDTLFEVGRGPV